MMKANHEVNQKVQIIRFAIGIVVGIAVYLIIQILF